MTDPAVTNRDGVGEAVAGPFTMRDITVALSVVLLFLASVLPAGVFRGIVFNMWNSGGLFQLGLSILLPVIVLVLFAIRRLAPKTKLRIGSLSVDQFASVVACFNAAYYFLELVSGLKPVSIIGFVGGLGLLSATVCARWIPQFRADFVGRPETTAHPVARDAIEPRPKTAKPKATTAPAARTGQAAAAAGGASAGAAAADAAAGPAGHSALASAAEGPRPGAGNRQGSTAVETKSGSADASVPSPAAGSKAEGSKAGAAVAGAAAAAAAGAGSASSAGTPGTGAAAGAGTARTSGASASSGTSGTGATAAGRTGAGQRVTAPTGSAAKTPSPAADDEAAPGAADGEAVGIPVSDDEAVASAAGRSAREGSAAASAEAAKETTPPAELGTKTEANSIAGAGSRGPDAAKGQPDAALSAAGATGRTAAEADRAPKEEERTREERAEDATASYPRTAAMGSVPAGDRTASATPISATREHYEEPEEEITYEAFWFAVGRTRPVFDENTGQVAFTLEPGAWILALQDRGDEFLVQHTDGRVGVLRDLTNIERA
ncbi:hypothetical protein [Arthrobacter sp. USHLN218]|uniref:hypothetical protein n=1 Tax=Arthrobacter sp. USHLN218 TaxID=3081232 RepID=UPI00301859FF